MLCRARHLDGPRELKRLKVISKALVIRTGRHWGGTRTSYWQTRGRLGTCVAEPHARPWVVLAIGR